MSWLFCATFKPHLLRVVLVFVSAQVSRALWQSTAVRNFRTHNRFRVKLSAVEDNTPGGTNSIKEAMGITNTTASADDMNAFCNIRSGLAGFAVDPRDGFVAILVGPSDSEKEENELWRMRAVSAVVSPSDVERVASPEALCLVQLAGGIDLGAVLQPDTLAQLAADLVDPDESVLPDSRQSLIAVRAVAHDEIVEIDHAGEMQAGSDDVSSLPSSTGTTKAREMRILEDAPRLARAVQSLPGLASVYPTAVLEAMRLHADEAGIIDRARFDLLLHTLRSNMSGTVKLSGQARICFDLDIEIELPSKTIIVTAQKVPTFKAVGLALRYGVPVHVGDDCLTAEFGGVEVAQIADRYPAVKTIDALAADSAATSSLVSGMFTREVMTAVNGEQLRIAPETAEDSPPEWDNKCS